MKKDMFSIVPKDQTHCDSKIYNDLTAITDTSVCMIKGMIFIKAFTEGSREKVIEYLNVNNNLFKYAKDTNDPADLQVSQRKSMEILHIENPGLTGYYLEQKLGDEPEESGIVFIPGETHDDKETIEIHYEDKADLEKKLSYILMVLTDK